MIYLFILSAVPALIAMALFNQTIRRNAKGEPIFFYLVAVVLLTIFTCFGVFLGVVEGLAQRMYQLVEAPDYESNLSCLELKTRNLKEQKPIKVLREKKEILGEKISKELGTKAIIDTPRSEDTGILGTAKL